MLIKIRLNPNEIPMSSPDFKLVFWGAYTMTAIFIER